jgi:hypothetical protein
MEANMSSVQSAVLPVLEQKLPKVIGPTTHGIIDYAHAAFFLGVALLYRGSNKRAARAALGTSAFILTQAMLTDYRFGVKPVLSFAAHGKLDEAFASASWIVPRIFGFNGAPGAKIFEVNSFAEAAVIGLTDFDSERARRERLAAGE